MAPDKHKILLDHLDKVLEEGRSPEALHPFPGDPEAPKEWRLLSQALEAIRFNGLVREVREVAQRFREEHGEIAAAPPATDDADHPVLSAVAAVEVAMAAAAAHQEAHYEEEEDAVYPAQANIPRIPLVRRMFIPAMKIAAGVALLLCLAGIAKYLVTTPYGIYERYYNSYDLGTTRGADGSSDLENAYRVKNWPEVENAFGVLTQKTNEDYFLMGMAYMEQTRYYEAMGMFRQIMKANDTAQTPYFQDEAQYYLGMSYLAVGQAAPARALLEKIGQNRSNPFYNQVRKMNPIDLLILKTK